VADDERVEDAEKSTVVYEHPRRFRALSYRRCRNQKMTATATSRLKPKKRLSNFTFSNNHKEFSTARRNNDSRSSTEDFANNKMILFCVRLIGKFLAPFIFPIKSHRTEEFRISNSFF